METYRLVLEYDGTRSHGWQEQANARSIAGELKRALAEAGAEVRELGGSGRTDAGVHALAQVAHLRLAAPVDPAALRRAVNDRLPPDIHVLAISPAPGRFHARHDAVLRSYLYQVSTRRTAFAKPHVWWVKRRLDVRLLRDAGRRLPGRRDYAAFTERPADQESTVVVVEACEVAEDGALVLVRIAASHFLWKMVRRLVGTMVKVGTGELSLDEWDALLAGRPLAPGRGSPAAWTAPSSGLFLEAVLYPGDPPLGPVVPAVPVTSEPRPGVPGRGRTLPRRRIGP